MKATRFTFLKASSTCPRPGRFSQSGPSSWASFRSSWVLSCSRWRPSRPDWTTSVGPGVLRHCPGQNSGSYRGGSVPELGPVNLVWFPVWRSKLTWKSLGASVIMFARPWVAARFSLRSRWSGRPRLDFLWADLQNNMECFSSGPADGPEPIPTRRRWKLKRFKLDLWSGLTWVTWWPSWLRWGGRETAPSRRQRWLESSGSRGHGSRPAGRGAASAALPCSRLGGARWPPELPPAAGPSGRLRGQDDVIS